MLEKDIEKWLGEQLKKPDCLYFKFTSPMNPGVPDRIVITPDGRTIYVELKTEIGRFSNIQKWQIDRMRTRGADVRKIKGKEEARAFVEEVRALCGSSRTSIKST
jgi:hypothetical protein